MAEEFNVERSFISCLLSTRDITTVREEGITPQFFTGDNKTVFSDIYYRHVKSGELMSLSTFRSLHPQYRLSKNSEGEVGTEEGIKFWIDALRKKVKHNMLADAVEESLDLLNDNRAEKAREVLIKTIHSIDLEIEKTEDTNINADLDVRRREYEKRKVNQGIIGIPTGIHYFDFLIRGFQKETLTTLIAPAGTGKTNFQVLTGTNAMLAGYSVIQGVTEMSASQMRDRYEMMLFAKKFGGINANHFKAGRLAPDIEEKYFKFLEEDMPDYNLPIFTAISPMQVAAEVEKHKPDLVLIDGVYLMQDDEKADSDWLRIAHITRALKKLVKEKRIAGFINSQADKNTSKKIGAELGDISFSQAIGQDSDNVCALFRNEQMRADREMCLKLLKNREGSLGKIMMSWDFTNMNFKELYHEQDTADKNAEGEDDDGYIDVNERE